SHRHALVRRLGPGRGAVRTLRVHRGQRRRGGEVRHWLRRYPARGFFEEASGAPSLVLECVCARYIFSRLPAAGEHLRRSSCDLPLSPVYPTYTAELETARPRRSGAVD